MKKCKKTKFLVIILIFIMFISCGVNMVNAAIYKDIYEFTYVKSDNQFKFNQREFLNEYAGNQTGGEVGYKYTYDVTEKMVNDKTAVALKEQGLGDGNINAMDTSVITSIAKVYKNTEDIAMNYILEELANTLNVKKADIELRATFYKPSDNSDIAIFSTKSTTQEQAESEIETVKEEIIEELIASEGDSADKEGIKEEISALNKYGCREEYTARRLARLDAIMPDGAEYTLVLAGKNYNLYHWYMVRTKEAIKEEPPVVQPPVEEPAKQFKTDLSYTAIVDGKVVDGTLKDGTYYPSYDRTKVEKDANVTAKITSTTKTDIVKINGVDLNSDGTKNSLGWYYADKSDKTVIVKDYPFENVDNIEDNGIVIEKDLILTSIDDLTDKQTVSIEWPFRIIDVTQTPEKIDDETKKVTVIITTNLPMEEEKLPDGWKFTEDEEGKTQHRIYKEFYKKDGNKEEDVVVIANNRDDKDNTPVKVVWPEKQQEEPKEEPKEELPEKIPQTGKNFGLVIAIISLAGVSVISYRKFRK